MESARSVVVLQARLLRSFSSLSISLVGFTYFALGPARFPCREGRSITAGSSFPQRPKRPLILATWLRDSPQISFAIIKPRAATPRAARAKGLLVLPPLLVAEMPNQSSPSEDSLPRQDIGTNRFHVSLTADVVLPELLRAASLGNHALLQTLQRERLPVDA